jgi:tRNA-2-methylthio-N6-dimethylallyladenosine synthase
MNVLDGERMAGQLEASGLAAAAEGVEADVVVLNTCAVREKAEAKVYSALGTLAARKRERPELVIGVTGCVAQVEADEIFERAPWVDFVLGTGRVEELGATVARIRRERGRAKVLDLPRDSPVYQFRRIARGSKFSAYVTAIEGCDQFCTFCVVPFTRGRERSRRAGEIVEEIRHLAANGFTEVTLLGQTVNAYRDPETGTGLGALLRRAASVEGLRRLRFVTSHPRFLDDALLEALAAGGVVAPFLHLPAQSGSDRILYRMKRRYGADEYRAIVARARARVADLAVTSDFIVGFPGEAEEDFAQTLALVADVRFEGVFAFRYSPRPGTAAARWGSAAEVPADVAADRLARLLALQDRIQREAHRALEGREVEVLIDGANRSGGSRGRARCNRVVHVDGPPISPGSYVRARVTRGLPNSLLATRVAAGEPRAAEGAA